MRVTQWQGRVVFQHEVAEGAAGRSWGVHVAQLAGVPAPVVRRAAALLAALEKDGGKLRGSGGPLAPLPLFAASADAAKPAAVDPVHEALAALDPEAMTPLAAMQALFRLKALLPVSDAGRA
jgi:DNA mismatch repair protein MutS